MTPAYNAIPKFLAKNGYQNPSKSAPFNMAYDTELPVFEWRKHNPENAKAGQAFMASQRMGQRSVWDGRVPMHDFELSQDDKAADRVVFCDVGGGFGHQCMDLRKHNTGIEGRFVTQDLPLVNDMIANKDELARLGIEAMPHNFMSVQPVKNAKVYYLRNVSKPKSYITLRRIQSHQYLRWWMQCCPYMPPETLLTCVCVVRSSTTGKTSHPRSSCRTLDKRWQPIVFASSTTSSCRRRMRRGSKRAWTLP